ncbi:aminotransferase class-III [Fusarium pseudocircinatum]|uniref:Aminotransferase class-III n=1 Tax=Fusarium pseudocircinatum TaxID=56676 RepID=A0A8H5PK41_9HYPO|nr:aminotransferase class-III [Fusarium pseudocircinatum]
MASDNSPPCVNVVEDVARLPTLERWGNGQFSDIFASSSNLVAPITFGIWKVDNFAEGSGVYDAEYDEVKYIITGESTWKDCRSGRLFRADAGSAIWLPKGSQTTLVASKNLRALYVEQTHRSPTRMPGSTDTWISRLNKLHDGVLSEYVRCNGRSYDRFNRALEHLPGGNTRSVLHYEPFPMTLSSGRDCYVTSADGVEYIDFVSEYSAAMFGHSNTTILQAIKDSLSNGVNLGGPGEAEVELAVHIKSRFKSIDKLRFCNSGSEANTMALALATSLTKRRKILAFQNGYHGGFIGFGQAPHPSTIPHEFVLGRFNDVENAKTLVSDDLAAIIVEPMQGAGGAILATHEFLSCLREAASRTGALLIFDEVVTSRLHINGLQEYFSIKPDITTLGKYIGGGPSFGAFGGRADLMDALDPRSGFLTHSGTYNNNVFTMAAGNAAAKLLTKEKIEKANSLGNRMRDGINAYNSQSVQASGFGSVVGIQFLGEFDTRLRDAFFFYMLKQRIYVGKRGFLSVSLVHEAEHADIKQYEYGFNKIRHLKLIWTFRIVKRILPQGYDMPNEPHLPSFHFKPSPLTAELGHCSFHHRPNASQSITREATEMFSDSQLELLALLERVFSSISLVAVLSIFVTFMQSDAWWSLGMSVNTFRIVFFQSNPHTFNKWLYSLICFGGPFISGFTLFFISTPARGPVYGATTATDTNTDINVQESEDTPATTVSDAQKSTPNATTVEPIPANQKQQSSTPSGSTKSKFWLKDPIKRAYLFTTFMFTLSVLVTWVPASITRIHSLLNRDVPYSYQVAIAAVMPLQGLWNALIFFTTSRDVLKNVARESWGHETEETVKVAKKTAEDFGKTLDAAPAAYTKASDNFPTGWEIIGQQVVSGLSECVTTALNQAIPALVDNLNPIAKAKAAARVIKGFTDKGDGEQKADAGSHGGSTPGGQTKQPPAVEARDPAYAQLARDLYLFDALNGIPSSPNGVNWQSTEVTKEKPNSGINFIYTMLKDSLTSISKSASNQVASVQHKQILSDAAKIAQEILEEAQKASSSLSYEKPGKDDPKVKKWQDVFGTLYADTYALNTKGRQLPGNSANSVGDQPAFSDQTAQINAKTQQAQVLLDAASKQLTAASETLKATTGTYLEASKQLVEQQTVLANIKAELTKLTKENMALDEIKIVLVQCIKLIINLQSQITNLVRFFGVIATTIDVVVSKTVTKFLKTVSIAVSSDPFALEMGNLKVGNYSLLVAERTISAPLVAESKREEILNGMYERLEDVSSAIKQLPAGTVPSQIQSVIGKTAKEVEEATKQEIVATAEYKPINQPSLRRKE